MARNHRGRPLQRRIPASDRENHYQNRNHDKQDRFPDSCSAQSGKIAGVHHPPDLQYCYDELLEHLTNSCDRLLTDNPNRNLIICGDPKDILTQQKLLQMVNTPTRKNKIRDVFITNVPQFFGEKDRSLKELFDLTTESHLRLKGKL